MHSVKMDLLGHNYYIGAKSIKIAIGQSYSCTVILGIFRFSAYRYNNGLSSYTPRIFVYCSPRHVVLLQLLDQQTNWNA